MLTAANHTAVVYYVLYTVSELHFLFFC